jgi:hypothetical protein
MQDVVCRNNIVYHTGTERYHQYAAGLMVASEDWGRAAGTFTSAENVDVYGNMIAGLKVPLAIRQVSTGSGYRVSNTRFYNNTVIEPFAGGNAFLIQPDAIGSGIVVEKNIFWQSISTASSASAYSGVTWNRNLWNEAPPSLAQSDTDPNYPDYPALDMAQYFAKTSGWHSITPGSLKSSDFDLLETATFAYGDDGTILGSNGISDQSPDAGENDSDLGSESLSQPTFLILD